MKNKKIVITGAAGFIGSNITHAIYEDNDVIAIDNLSTGNIDNISDILSDIDFKRESITDLEMLKAAFKDADYVLHLAAIPSVPRSINNPIATNEANVTGTLNVLAAARDTGVKRVVFSSSSSVYGNTETLPKIETMPPCPLSPYATSKLTGENYCRNFYEIYGLETVALRYFNVFGPKQDPNSQYAAVIPKFITAISSDRQPEVYGDGNQTRDFTYVENVVQANIKACTSQNGPGKVYNIGCGEQNSLNKLIELINKHMDKDICPIFKDTREGDVRDSLASITAAKNDLGYSPTVNFEQGLLKTIAWFT